MRRLSLLLPAASTLLLCASGAPPGSAADGDTDIAVAFVSQSPGTDPLGPTATSTWRVTNLGPGNARDVAVTFSADWGSGPTPIGILASLENGQCVGAGSTNAYCETTGTLEPGAQLTLSLDTNATNLDSGQSESVPMSVHVLTDFAPDPNPGNDTASATVVNTRAARTTAPPGAPTPPPPPPAPRPVVHLVTTMTPERDAVVVGDTVTVHYSITNDGGLTPSQYDIQTSIDGPARFVGVSSSQGTCSAGGQVVCSNLYLPPRAQMSVDAQLRALGPGAIALRSVWFAEPGASPLWDYFTASGGSASLTASPRTADLALSLDRIPARTRVGIPAIVAITVANSGPDPVPDAVVDVSAQHFQITRLQPARGTCPGVSRCRLPTLAAGARTRFLLVLRPLVARSGRLFVRVGSSAAADASPLNNTIVRHVEIDRVQRDRHPKQKR